MHRDLDDNYQQIETWSSNHNVHCPHIHRSVVLTLNSLSDSLGVRTGACGRDSSLCNRFAGSGSRGMPFLRTESSLSSIFLLVRPRSGETDTETMMMVEVLW